MISLIAAMLMSAATPDVQTSSPPSPAAEKTVADQASAGPTPKPQPEKICWDETPTGTRFSHKVCATREQLEQRRRDDQDWKMGLRAHPASGN